MGGDQRGPAGVDQRGTSHVRRARVRSTHSAGWSGWRGVARGDAGKLRLPDGRVGPRLTDGQPGASTAWGLARPRAEAEGEVGASRCKNESRTCIEAGLEDGARSGITLDSPDRLGVEFGREGERRVGNLGRNPGFWALKLGGSREGDRGILLVRGVGK